jgi:hypothetical protein
MFYLYVNVVMLRCPVSICTFASVQSSEVVYNEIIPDIGLEEQQTS